MTHISNPLALAAFSLQALPAHGQNLLRNGGRGADAAGAAPSGWTLVGFIGNH